MSWNPFMRAAFRAGAAKPARPDNSDLAASVEKMGNPGLTALVTLLIALETEATPPAPSPREIA